LGRPFFLFLHAPPVARGFADRRSMPLCQASWAPPARAAVRIADTLVFLSLPRRAPASRKFLHKAVDERSQFVDNSRTPNRETAARWLDRSDPLLSYGTHKRRKQGMKKLLACLVALAFLTCATPGFCQEKKAPEKKEETKVEAKEKKDTKKKKKTKKGEEKKGEEKKAEEKKAPEKK
jgi:hypothetical protein